MSANVVTGHTPPPLGTADVLNGRPLILNMFDLLHCALLHYGTLPVEIRPHNLMHAHNISIKGHTSPNITNNQSYMVY